MGRQKYYAVFEGKQRGVFDSWPACRQAIHGVSGARYKSFASRREAEQALEAHRQAVANDHGPVVPSLCVDAALSGRSGLMEYRGVETHSRRELFRRGPFPGATNNIGEFLAVVHALAYCKKHKLLVPIYSDSRTAISWVVKRKVQSKVDMSSALWPLIQRALAWLANHTYENRLLQWNSRLWGENPADFGRK